MRQIYFLFLFAMLFASCTKDSDINYSCNKKIDDWVKNNIKKIHQMDEAEFSSYNENVQRGIFAAMYAEQRYNLWKSKLNNILSLDWKKEEKDHLRNLLIFIENHSNIFDTISNEETEDELVLFMYQWNEYANNVLKWDNTTLYNIYGTLAKPYKIQKNHQTRLSIFEEENKKNIVHTKSRTEISTEFNPKNECECNSSEDFCTNRYGSSSLAGSYTAKCESKCTKPSEKGCGYFWYAECNGGCNIYFTSSFQ